MEKRLEEESVNQTATRQYECLRKYDKIVNQYDQLTEAIDSVTQLPRRRKTSNRIARKKSSSSGGGAIHSVPTSDEATSSTADQGDTSKTSSSPTKAKKTSVLVQIITKHLRDLQSDQPPESSSGSRDH